MRCRHRTLHSHLIVKWKMNHMAGERASSMTTPSQTSSMILRTVPIKSVSLYTSAYPNQTFSREQAEAVKTILMRILQLRSVWALWILKLQKITKHLRMRLYLSRSSKRRTLCLCLRWAAAMDHHEVCERRHQKNCQPWESQSGATSARRRSGCALVPVNATEVAQTPQPHPQPPSKMKISNLKIMYKIMVKIAIMQSISNLSQQT